MSKRRSKGTILQVEISSVYTPVTQLTSIGFDGAEVETFDGRTLDQVSAFVPYPCTGYTEPGSCSFEGFYDADLAPHAHLGVLLTTPDDDQSWRVIYSDSSFQSFDGGGVSLGITADPGDGLRFSGAIKISGDPGFNDTVS